MRRALLSVIGSLLISGVAAAGQPMHHELAVRLDPAAHRLEVTDWIILGEDIQADGDGAYRFVLHAGLDPEVLTAGWKLEPVPGAVPAGFLGINATSETAGDVPLAGYRLIPSAGAKQPVEISYRGVIDHPLDTSGEEYQRSFSETPGLIGPDGVFLAGSSYWVPTFGDNLVIFDLTVRSLTPPWDVVTQGGRLAHDLDGNGLRFVSWRCDKPQEEIYLVAGPWHEYDAMAGTVHIYAFLRKDDPALAHRYLEATRRYLKLYDSMLPPYPYGSFALVENFWETGYGMPGFTLLGPRVIRFPWILTSSYPHELLHNWWGNSAYVDFSSGNWCEGLTAYMADHLFAEQRGRGATYRRATLKKFTDFARGGKDFPLSKFHNRFSAASEAVGYGKSLMLFHMVRRAIGDEAFLEALSAFYRQHRFTRASFDDLAQAFSKASGKDWRPFFEQWTTRTGAPELEIASVKVEHQANDLISPWIVHLTLRQVQAAAPFPITVPVVITLGRNKEPVVARTTDCGRECRISIRCTSQPLRLDVDPGFDVMRRLDPMEVPPALSTLFGAGSPTFVLPSRAPASELAAWKALAAAWAQPATPRTVLDTEIATLPGGDVWVLGWTNRFARTAIERLSAQGVGRSGAGVSVAGKTYEPGRASLVLVARGERPANAVAWVAAPAAAIPGLARKLPHYTRYSWLTFTGDAPDNTGKGMWKPIGSPLVRNLAGGPLPELHLPPARPLAQLPPSFDAAAMKATVDFLASPELEGRGLGTPGLERATAWVEERFKTAGLKPAGEHGYRQSWSWTGGEPPHEMSLTNLLGLVPGTDPALSDHPVLVTAHLDHLGHGWPDVRHGNEGKIHPGADDNASGVAVLLELARRTAAEPPRPRPILFAVVTGEEAGLLGSHHLIESLGANHLPFACINLDTVGRLSEGKLYVLNTDSARQWPFIWRGVGYTTGAPVTIVAEPLDASDQGSCLAKGVPAVQLFTGPTPDYHRPSDTPDKIDAEGMAVVAEAAHEAMAWLAERKDPLTVTIANTPAAAPSPIPRAGSPSGARASLGTLPDFGYNGYGVRVERVVPGSAADRAGIWSGDVITAIDGEHIVGLRKLSKVLKAHRPGDTITVTVERNDVEQQIKVTLGTR